MTNAKLVVNTLLESLPGSDYATIDSIMQIIYSVVDKIAAQRRPYSLEALEQFEAEVNPLVAQYGIKFDHNDSLNKSSGSVARVDPNGMVINTPTRINRSGFSRMSLVLSHEAVHMDQVQRARNTGDVNKQASSSERRIRNKDNSVNWHGYHTDKHEIAAYARTAIDNMHNNGQNKASALKSLRTGSPSHLKRVDIPSHNRFLKKAAGYAEQELPD